MARAGRGLLCNPKSAIDMRRKDFNDFQLFFEICCDLSDT